MTPQLPSGEQNRWKLITLAAGVGAGALFGGAVAFLYARTAEATMVNKGRRPQVSTMSMIGLSISAISLVRQIVQMGSDD